MVVRMTESARSAPSSSPALAVAVEDGDDGDGGGAADEEVVDEVGEGEGGLVGVLLDARAPDVVDVLDADEREEAGGERAGHQKNGGGAGGVLLVGGCGAGHRARTILRGMWREGWGKRITEYTGEKRERGEELITIFELCDLGLFGGVEGDGGGGGFGGAALGADGLYGRQLGAGLSCGCGLAGGAAEDGGDGFKLAAEAAELLDVECGDGFAEERELRCRRVVAELRFEQGAGAGDGVALLFEEGFDAQGHLDVAAAVEALAGASLVGLELGELTLPETEDVGGDLAEACDLADAEVELVGDIGRGGAGWLGASADWLVVSHLQTRTSDESRPE